MVRWIALVLVATLFSGCSTDPPSEGEPTLNADDEVKVTSDTGAIRGVVVDRTITPVMGASIEASCATTKATTKEDGSFAFSDIAPGACFLTVSKPGYATVQSSTDVVAGVERPPALRIQIEKVPGLEPNAEVLQWDGRIECSVRFVVNALAACASVTALDDDYAERYRDIPMPTFVQSEMVWKSTQVLGESLKLQYTDDSNGLDNFVISQGPSPRIINTDNQTLATKHYEDRGLYVRVFTGDYQGTGLSLTMQQDFTVYTSWYWNYAPPEGWRFIDNSELYPAPE